jgi:hypothetical protein
MRVEQIPGVDTLLARIRGRKRRDYIILVMVLSTCTILFLIHILS